MEMLVQKKCLGSWFLIRPMVWDGVWNKMEGLRFLARAGGPGRSGILLFGSAVLRPQVRVAGLLPLLVRLVVGRRLLLWSSRRSHGVL